MKNNPWNDIIEMHQKFGVGKAVEKMDEDMLKKFLHFRIACLEEEMEELKDALTKNDAEEIVDGIVDWIVFGLGTLEAFKVNFPEAWKAVHEANMSKIPGVKPERPNPFGLPDLIKKSDWKAPSHAGNTGIIPKE